MRALSYEKREQEKDKTIILWAKTSRSAITKIWNRYQKTGEFSAKAHTGRPSRITPEIEQKIRIKIRPLA